ncbi:hypothetical protein NL676_019391 [Syzygium grande]|nr:hypothetical protein NL676_019391 [Syzygium grande]
MPYCDPRKTTPTSTPLLQRLQVPPLSAVQGGRGRRPATPRLRLPWLRRGPHEEEGPPFSELCGYFSLREDELRRKWERMEDGERRGLATEFMSNWNADFHLLSASSIVEMVEEHLQHGKKLPFFE